MLCLLMGVYVGVSVTLISRCDGFEGRIRGRSWKDQKGAEHCDREGEMKELGKRSAAVDLLAGHDIDPGVSLYVYAVKQTGRLAVCKL